MAAGQEKEEVVVKTIHRFALKKIVDDADLDGGLRMTGTLYQMPCLSEAGLTEDEIKNMRSQEPGEKEKQFIFDYRFNEVLQKEDEVRMRHVKGTGVSVLSANIPLELETMSSIFPFQIKIASATIHLNTHQTDDKVYRPDLLLHKTDPTQQVGIFYKSSKASLGRFGKKWTKYFLENYRKCNNGSDNTSTIIESIDRSSKYTLLSPYPEVHYELKNENKKVCQTFRLEFYVVSANFSKIFSLFLPMILVTFVAFLNVWNDMQQDAGTAADSHLQISSALTLAIAFVLTDACNHERLLCLENYNTFLFFLGLVLASVPKSLFSVTWEQVGVTMMFLSLVLPIVHFWIYFVIWYQIRAQAWRCRRQFLVDNKMKATNTKLDEYSTFQKLKEKNGNEKYTVEEGVRLCWNIENHHKAKVIDQAPEQKPKQGV